MIRRVAETTLRGLLLGLRGCFWMAVSAGVGLLIIIALSLIWTWTPMGLAYRLGECEQRLARLEQLHAIDHELDRRRDNYWRGHRRPLYADWDRPRREARP